MTVQLMHVLPSRAFVTPDEAGAERLACQNALARSFAAARMSAFPYPHALLADLLPLDLVWSLADLPFAPPPPPLIGCTRPPTGRMAFITHRETEAFTPCRLVAETFQSAAAMALISRATGARLSDCRLRIALAQEVDGHQCPPRTRQDEARFTVMVALDAGGQRNLGPDIYFESGDWAAQAPWTPGCALAFAPSARSWHGFEPRMIREVRKSLIVDYVPTDQATAAELAFPDRPVGWDA
jgi:hypothetical protein